MCQSGGWVKRTLISVCGELITDFEAYFLAATKEYCSTEQREDAAVLTCDPAPLAERLCLHELKMCRPDDFGISAGNTSTRRDDGSRDTRKRNPDDAAISSRTKAATSSRAAPAERGEASDRKLGVQGKKGVMVILGEDDLDVTMGFAALRMASLTVEMMKVNIIPHLKALPIEPLSSPPRARSRHLA